MSSSAQTNQELIGKAERGEWSLECDEKILLLMQNVASKIENRSANTKSNMNTMMLSLDETKVKLSNLTRKKNSIKSSNYCENLISEDDNAELDAAEENDSRKEPVKFSPQVALDNGMKLMDRCFEKHQVNLDPSSSRSETSIIYRPIDKYLGVLPHLIGSDKWKHKWHVGLLDVDPEIVSRADSEQYAESVDSNIEPTDSVKPYMDESLLPSGSGLMSSQDSPAKSAGSLNDHLVINNSGGLFDDVEDEHMPATKASATNPAASIFRPQPEQRKIVNLFDDEPPSLEPSPTGQRKPVNLFDDYGSVDSLPIPTATTSIAKQPPVDLFNDDEFDNFIIEIEQSEVNEVHNNVASQEAKPSGSKVQQDMRKISEEIKTVQLKKVEPNVPRAQTVPQPTKRIVQPAPEVVKSIPEVKKAVPEVKKIEKVIANSEPEAKPVLKKITNLFDDDEDDPDDFFTEIMKQKTAAKAVEPAAAKADPVKTKVSSLFDDDTDEDDKFADIFSKKPSAIASSLRARDSPKADKKPSLLFADDEPPSFVDTQTKLFAAKSSTLFSETEESNSETKPEVPRQDQKFKVAEKEKSPPSVVEAPKPAQNPEVPEPFQTPEVVEASKPVQNPEVPQPAQIPEVAAPTKTPEASAIVEPLLTEEEDSIMGIRQSQSYNIAQFESPPEAKLTIKPTEPISIDPKRAKDKQPQHSTPTKSLNTTLPFLNDEPPEDDDMWDAEDHYDDPDPKPVSRNVFSPNTSSSYSTVPLFDDDIPPDDDFPSTKPPVPEFDSEDDFEASFFTPQSHVSQDISSFVAKRGVSVDESDHSPSAGNIKSKLDIFTRKADDKPSIQKPLPGKLNTNIKINVGALLPGARAPLSARITPELPSSPEDSVSEPSNVSSGSSSSSYPSAIDRNNNSNLLNNELAKSRARVQVRRRPSTRRGRQASYQKALSDHVEVESDVDDDEQSETPTRRPATVPALKKTEIKAPPPESLDEKEEVAIIEETTSNKSSVDPEESPKVDAHSENKKSTKNLSTSIFDDDDDAKQISEKTKINDEKPTKISRQADKVNVQIEPAADRSSIFEETIKENSIMSEIPAKSSIFDDHPPPLDAVPIIDKLDIQAEPSKNLSTSIFDDMDDDDDILAQGNPPAAVQARVTSSIFDDQPPPLEPSASVTNKISVFYDDEDDTRMSMENQKRLEEEKSMSKAPLMATLPPADVSNHVASRQTESVKKAASTVDRQSIFDDGESDDDLFGSTKSKSEVAPSKAPVKSAPPQQSKSLFDDADDDDLFAKIPIKVAPKSSKLFDSDDDGEPSGSIISAKPKSAQPKKQSLFGDDTSDDDDDDLFSSKPKSQSSKPATSASRSTIIKKPPSKAVDDPLKDLLNN